MAYDKNDVSTGDDNRERIRLIVQGSVLRVHTLSGLQRQYIPRRPRGVSKLDHPRSRRRLCQRLNTLRADQPFSFYTLTFPDEFISHRRAKDKLSAYLRSLSRIAPSACGLWMLDRHLNQGNIHFHLLLFKTEGIVIRDVKTAWSKRTGGFAHHETGYDLKGAIKYLCNRTLDIRGWRQPGNLFAFFGKKNLEFAPIRRYEFPVDERFDDLKREANLI